MKISDNLIKKVYRIFKERNMKKPIIGIIGKVQPQYGEDIWHRINVRR